MEFTICSRIAVVVLIVACLVVMFPCGGTMGQSAGRGPPPRTSRSHPTRQPPTRSTRPPRTTRPRTNRPPHTPTPPSPGGCNSCPAGRICQNGRCVNMPSTYAPPPTIPQGGKPCKQPTILHTLERYYRNSTWMFLNYLRQEFGGELISLLNDSRIKLTVFAPTNAAFSAAFNGTTESKVYSNSECLRATLRLHVVPRMFNTSQLLRERSVGTLQGFHLRVTPTSGRPMLQVNSFSSGGRSAQSTRVQIAPRANIAACNGVIHFIDSLLTPGFTLPDTETLNLFNAMRRYPNLSDFVDAVETTAMETLLSQPSGYTVFAPTNAAFQQLAQSNTNKSLAVLKAQPDLTELIGLVRNHISQMPYPIGALVRNAHNRVPVVNLNGNHVNNSIVLTTNASIQVFNATIEQSNITGSNGLIHVISRVITQSSAYNFCLRKVIERGRCSQCLGNQPSKLSCGTGQPLLQHGITTSGCRQHTCAYVSCESTRTERVCCTGHFGSKCLRCPGTLHVCSGNGNCMDGMGGSGKCHCNSGFTGAACDVRLTARNTTDTRGPPIPPGLLTTVPSGSVEASGDANSGSSSSRSEYFLIPLSVGATLALLVVIAGIVLWRMKRRMVSITQSPTTERVPTPTTDFQPVPGSAYVVARPPGQKPVVIISSPGMAAFYASPSGTTMESIPEEAETKSTAEEDAASDDSKQERKSLSNVSIAELVANQEPIDQNKESPTESLEATSSNELLER